MAKDKIFEEALKKTKADLNIKDLKEAREMVKDIPATDGVLTPIEGAEEKELTPYPEIEFDVVMEASLEKFKRKVNQMLGQGWQTGGGMNAVAVGNGIRFYQSMIRWNVDGGLKPEMPSRNSEAGGQGPEPLHIPGLENEPDLYEDVNKDVDKTEGGAVEG